VDEDLKRNLLQLVEFCFLGCVSVANLAVSNLKLLTFWLSWGSSESTNQAAEAK
jgi:hypothetical protein